MTESVTVFVTNMASDHNYEAAAKYGAVRPVTTGNYPVFKTARLIEEISDVLAYSTADDYLVFSGSGFVASLCLLIWLSMHKECKVLLFNNQQKGYIPRVLKKGDISIQIEKSKDKLELKRRNG